MERTNDGERTWAMWKTAVLGLPADALHRYLRDAEKFSEQKVATFVNDGGVIQPEDWAPSSDAADALNRFYAWKKATMDLSEDPKYQEVRGAALPSREDER